MEAFGSEDRTPAKTSNNGNASGRSDCVPVTSAKKPILMIQRTLPTVTNVLRYDCVIVINTPTHAFTLNRLDVSAIKRKK